MLFNILKYLHVFFTCTSVLWIIYDFLHVKAFMARFLWHHNGDHQRVAYCCLLASTLNRRVYGSCALLLHLSASFASDLWTRLRDERSIREFHTRVGRYAPPVADTFRVFLHLRRRHADRHSH